MYISNLLSLVCLQSINQNIVSRPHEHAYNESPLEFFERKGKTDIRYIKVCVGGGGLDIRYSVIEDAHVRKGGRGNVKAYRCIQGGGWSKNRGFTLWITSNWFNS